jgi:ABC-type dipeptide/oligopeptide/nickel transport system permease component
MIRASAREVLGERYVLVARAKGAPEQRVLRRHVFRNAILPRGDDDRHGSGVAFGSTIFVERVFNLGGLGSLSVAALRGEVYPVVDPRIRPG